MVDYIAFRLNKNTDKNLATCRTEMKSTWDKYGFEKKKPGTLAVAVVEMPGKPPAQITMKKWHKGDFYTTEAVLFGSSQVMKFWPWPDLMPSAGNPIVGKLLSIAFEEPGEPREDDQDLFSESSASRAPLNGPILDHHGFNDVGVFHAKMGLDHAIGRPAPRQLDPTEFLFRYHFMLEELVEMIGEYRRGNLAGVADALIDLVYVAYGTAHLMGLPWAELWAEVQRANLTKERASGLDDPRSKRSSDLDVVKPEGWRPADLEAILKKYR